MSYFIYLIYIQKKYSKLETHAYNTFCLIHADVKVFEGMYVVHWYGIAQYKKCDTLVSQKVPITLQDKVPCHCIKKCIVSDYLIISLYSFELPFGNSYTKNNLKN